MRAIAKPNYLPKSSMAFSDPTYVSRIRPRQINIDKERLYEENLILKQLCNTLSEENTQLKTKQSQLEKELEKTQQSTSPEIKSTSHLVENLKTVIRDVKAELQAKDKELDLLKRSTRLTKMQEMGEELQQYANECMRLKRMLMEVVNDKKPWPDNSGFLEQLQNEREQLQQALRFYQDSDALKSEEILNLKKQLKKNDPEKDTSKKMMKDELEKLKNQLNDERKINELKPEKSDVAMQSSLAREEEERVNEAVKSKDEEIRNLYLEMSAMEKKATRQEKIISELQKEIKDLNSRALEDTKKKELINEEKGFEVASTKMGIKLEDSYKKLDQSIKSDKKSESSDIKSKESEIYENQEEYVEKPDPVQEVSIEKDYNEEESYKEQEEFENPNEDVYIPDDKIELESAKLNPKEEEGFIISFLMKIKYFLMQNKFDIQEWVSDIDINKIGIINLDDLQTVLSQEAINLSQNEYDCFMKRFGENDHQVLVSVLIEELTNMEMDDMSDTSYDSNNKESSWILKIDKSLAEIVASEIGTRFNYNVVRDKKQYIELILTLEEYDKDFLGKLFSSENVLIEKDTIREALILSILDEKETVSRQEVIEKLGFLLKDWKPLTRSDIEGAIRRLRSLLMDEIDVIGSRVEEKSQGSDFVSMNIIIEELRIHRIITQKWEFSWAMTQLFSYNQSIYKVPYKQALEDMHEGIPFTDLKVYENPETSQIEEAGSAVFEEYSEVKENNSEPKYKEEYQESFNSDIDEN